MASINRKFTHLKRSRSKMLDKKWLNFFKTYTWDRLEIAQKFLMFEMLYRFFAPTLYIYIINSYPDFAYILNYYHQLMHYFWVWDAFIHFRWHLPHFLWWRRVSVQDITKILVSFFKFRQTIKHITGSNWNCKIDQIRLTLTRSIPTFVYLLSQLRTYPCMNNCQFLLWQ